MSSKRRQIRVAERIKQEASNIILHELNDPRMGFVTVTDAHISADLHYARICLSVLGGPADERKTMQALEHARGYIQRTIAQRMRLRRAPVIAFEIDDSAKKRAHISGLIQQIKDEEGEGTDGSSGDNGSAAPDGPSGEEL